MKRRKSKAVPLPQEGSGKWVIVDEVRHWRSGKMMKRKDGLPFRFFIKPKRRVA